MSDLDERCASLRAQITATEAQLTGLKRELASAQEAAAAKSNSAELSDNQQVQSKSASRWPLLQEEYKRYGRQMIVSQVGLEGEFHSSVLGL
jgi:adenylyltransferase/sulfurtransferase